MGNFWQLGIRQTDDHMRSGMLKYLPSRISYGHEAYAKALTSCRPLGLAARRPFFLYSVLLSIITLIGVYNVYSNTL
jgi:hypothetical protein